MMQPAGRESLIVVLVVLNVIIQLQWTTLVEAVKDELNYDPEYNSNGIITELEIARLVPAPSIKKWSYDDHHDDENYLVLPARPADRRSDIDDDDEDEKDEEKSGSSAHGSYSESPAYGESAKAAQDGDDIESFFDTHLGPHDAAEVPERDDAPGPAPNGRTKLIDPDDQYDTAASSPLSEIFQSLLKVHWRPIVITTTQKAPPSSPVAPSSTRPVVSSTMLESSSTGSSATSLAGIPFVSGSPFLDQSHQYSGQSSNNLAPSSTSNHDDTGNVVREVYIARRPSLFAPFTAKVVEQPPPSPPPPPQSQYHFQEGQWRGIPTNSDIRTNELEDRQPVSASFNSYSTGPNHPMTPTPGGYNDEQTVSYGLSFGSNSGSSGSGLFPSLLASLGGSSSSSSSLSNQNEEPSQTSHNTGYNSMANSMRQPISAPVSYHNNYRQPYYQSVEQATNQMYQQKHNPYQQQMTQGQYNPMESVPGFTRHQYGTNNYGRNRGGTQAADESMDSKNWIIRQHLIAKVDQQLKNNPYYRQNLAQASHQLPIADYSKFQPQIPQHSKTSQQHVVESNVAMLNSMHSVSDPHSTFTTTTSVMSEPLSDDSVRKGINLDPSGSTGNDMSSTRLIATHKPIPISKCAESTSAKTGQQVDSPLTQHTSTVSLNNSQRKSDLQRNKSHTLATSTSKSLTRVRREDTDDRENDDVDDDGVWVDDEEDDDNKQIASDVNETSQEPQDDSQDDQSEQTESKTYVNPSGYIGHPHGYEIAL